MKRRLRPTIGACLIGAWLTTGCDWLEERFKTCEDVRVDLVNSQQTLGPIFIAGPEESFGAASRLESGTSRSLLQCLEKGDRKRFRAGNQSGETVATVTCVAGRTAYEGQPAPQVVWFTTGLECLDW